MTRASTWSNPDGLIVGFGPNYAERQVGGVVKQEGVQKEAKVQFTYQSTLGASGASIVIPAGSVVSDVYMKVGTAWVGGTSLSFGDATTPGGYVTTTAAATANLTAGAAIPANGAYIFTATEGKLVPKVFATETTLFITVAGTFTAGTAEITVVYV